MEARRSPSRTTYHSPRFSRHAPVRPPLNELNFARFDAKLEQRIGEVKTELADLRANLIKWMFLFWMGQAGLTVGLVLLVAGRR